MASYSRSLAPGIVRRAVRHGARPWTGFPDMNLLPALRATSTPIVLDSVDVKTDAGAMEEIPIPGLCLVDPPR